MKAVYIIISIAITLAIGSLLAHYGDKDSIINFLREFPNISGILLSGVLASLAIIFGLMGIDELNKIQKIESINKIGSYENLLRELKEDVWVVLGVVIISTLLSVFSSSDTEIFTFAIDNITISVRLFKILFVFDFIFFICDVIGNLRYNNSII